MELLAKLWYAGGGDKPTERIWLLLPNSASFEGRYDRIQDDLSEVGGANDFRSGKFEVVGHWAPYQTL